MAAVYHMVHYRHFEVTGGSCDGKNLEHLCRAALDQADQTGTRLWERAGDRLYRLGDTHGGQLLLNKVADLQEAVFGELCLVESRGLQALLQMKAKKEQLSNITLAEIFDLEERQAPEGSQFVRGLGYWLIIKDHVFVLRTQAMSADHLHSYINWLLKDATKTVEVELTFDLQAELDRSIASVGDIRRLRVSSRKNQATMEPVVSDQPEPTQVKTRKRIRDTNLENEQARPIWDAIVGRDKTSSFIDALGPNEYISADASLSIRGTRTEETKNKLKQLAGELADRTDEKVQIEGSDGRLSEGDAILRTRMPFSVPHEGSTLLEFDNVADQLRTVYSRFVQDGKIDA